MVPLLVLLFAAAPPAASGVPAPAPCYVAFLHGSGPDLHDEGAGPSARVESYFSPDGAPGASFTYHAGRQGQGARSCAIVRVGFDGGVPWWHARAAGRAARTLGAFIERHAIPDGALVLVGHSLGGLVARYVVNNGVPEAPYFDEHAANDPAARYSLVRRKTALVVTVQTPHTGAQAADALYGQADHALTNEGLALLKLFGVDRRSGANASLTRAYLEAAGAPGGEMGDEGRTIPLYTVAGLSPASPVRQEADAKLAAAWAMLCYARAPLNGWGAACRWDFWNFDPVVGDGMVERTSAHGLWTRASPGATAGIAGARVAWLDVEHNHNQGRFNAVEGAIVDRVLGVRTRGYLGAYLGGALEALLVARAPAFAQVPDASAATGGPGPEVERYDGLCGRLSGPRAAERPPAARVQAPTSDERPDALLASTSVRLETKGEDLLVGVEAEVARAGEYWAYAELWGGPSGTRPIAFARRRLGRLATGPQTVTLFVGGALIRRAALAPPYVVKQLRLARVDVHPPRAAPPLTARSLVPQPPAAAAAAVHSGAPAAAPPRQAPVPTAASRSALLDGFMR